MTKIHSPQVMTVLGPVAPHTLGVTDAHNHLWIEPVTGAAADSPVLTKTEAILAELITYRQAGGGAMVDCQPGGCGRNGIRLAELSQASGVQIVACTGFHRSKYYPPDFWLWQARAEQAARHFIHEIISGLVETGAASRPVRAGFIKIACEATLAQMPAAVLEGAALAAREIGAAIEIHTEQGAAAAAILDYFVRQGVRPAQLILCHMDKNPVFDLHRDLVQAGALLEYDTFYRPKYAPETHLWPLLTRVVEAGLEDGVTLATDMADARLWQTLGGGPGLAGLLTHIRPRLQTLGLQPETIQKLLGRNIAQRLACDFSSIGEQK
jgi:5-phospho-D-xylono-1,4-lactonase